MCGHQVSSGVPQGPPTATGLMQLALGSCPSVQKLLPALLGSPSEFLPGATGLASNMHPYPHNHPLFCHCHCHHETTTVMLGEQDVTSGPLLRALHVGPVWQADSCPSHVTGAVTEAQRGC